MKLKTEEKPENEAGHYHVRDDISHHHGCLFAIDGFQMSIKRPTSGGQTRNQEAPVQ